MKSILPKFIILATILILVIGCSNSDSTIPKNKNGTNTTTVTSKDNEKSTDTGSKDKETVGTYLKNEFTGPNDEFKNAMDKFYKTTDFDPSLYKDYLEKYYKPIVTDDIYDEIFNANLSLNYLKLAYRNGYQMKPTNIAIKKQDNNGYSCEVEVEYSKNGETKKTTVKEYLNINDAGRITRINMIDDGGLAKEMSPPKKENKQE